MNWKTEARIEATDNLLSAMMMMMMKVAEAEAVAIADPHSSISRRATSLLMMRTRH